MPETDRSWEMRGMPVPLPPADLRRYRSIIEAFRRAALGSLCMSTRACNERNQCDWSRAIRLKLCRAIRAIRVIHTLWGTVRAMSAV